MLRRQLLALLLCLTALPAWAGGIVTLGCGDWSQDYMVGTGRQFRGEGLELWPMVCLSSGKLTSFARVMDAGNFALLRQLAAQPAKDTDRLSDWITAHPELAQPLIRPEMFGQPLEQLTFGDLRSTVDNAAQPTEETVLESRFVYWTHPTCTGRVVPFDYYLETGAPCPTCNGGKLRVVPGPAHPEWD